MILTLWIILCLITGYFGRNRAIGFAGFFVLSLIFSPPIMLLILLLTAPKDSSPSPRSKSTKSS